jgi:hypothetical protein
MKISGRDFETTKAFPSILNHDYNDPKLDPETAELKELRDELLLTGHSQRFAAAKESVEVGESGLLSNANAYMGILLHSTERFKREMTVTAQYKAELAKLKKEGKTITPELRKTVAQEAVRDSLMLNGGSSSLTKPGYTQHPIWSVVGMYKQYASLQYYLQGRLLSTMLRDVDPNDANAQKLKRAAWSQWLTMSAMSAALSGVRGMPLMGVVFAVYNAFADDEEDDAETLLRKTIGTGATEGVFASALNMNIGPRIEYTNMLIRDTTLPDGASIWDWGVAMFGGPTFGSINRVVRGIELIQEGRLDRGVESMMPVALSNMFKTGRFATEGALTLRGDPVTEDVNAGALMSQFLGFAPADYARSMGFTTRQNRYEDSIMDKRNRLYERIYTAYRTSDSAGYLTALEDIIEFNRAYPLKPIKSSDLKQSVDTRDRNTAKMRMGSLPGAGFEGRWEEEADAWGF